MPLCFAIAGILFFRALVWLFTPRGSIAPTINADSNKPAFIVKILPSAVMRGNVLFLLL